MMSGGPISKGRENPVRYSPVWVGAIPCRTAATYPRSETILSAKGVGHGNLAPRLGDRVVMAFARYSMERSDRQIECRAGGAAFRLPVPVLRVQGPAVGTLPIATESGDPA